MRVNLIGNFRPNTGLQQDAAILRGLLTSEYGDSVQMFKVPHILPHCQEAEINMFIEVMNPALISYAKKNIWIPNLEWTYRTWIPYLKMMDEVWVKTEEAFQIFSMLVEGTSTKVHLTGWTSIDKFFEEKKNYSKAIVLVGKNIFRNPKQLFRAYNEILKQEPSFYEKLPHLYVPYNPGHVTLYCPPQLESKVTLISKELNEEEYDSLLKECGLAICMSACEGFGHAVNEAMSSGCNLLLSSIAPFKQLTSQIHSVVLWTEVLQTMPQTDCLGTLVDSSTLSIINELRNYVFRTNKSKKSASSLIRLTYERTHAEFVKRVRQIMEKVPDYTLASTLPKEEDLPDVSIITLTKDRRTFMELAKYSYSIQTYPRHKLEWVVVDDGEDCIEDTLIGVPNVKYIRTDPIATIGEKRNLAIEKAMYNTIVMMDDDDIYPENSVLFRVSMLLKQPAKECVFCTILPCYDITKYSSFMNVPPITLHMSERVSEATLAFTRQFWETQKFDAIHIAEGNTFIRGREQMCREVSPQEVIVSLVHPKNTSSRRAPEMKEPNGCHYGFNDTLFTLVSEIGEKLNTAPCLREVPSCETSCDDVCRQQEEQQP
jgi:hypothetical protein